MTPSIRSLTQLALALLLGLLLLQLASAAAANASATAGPSRLAARLGLLEPEFDQLSAWDRFPHLADKWARNPLTPKEYRDALRTDDPLYKLSERRATFFHELAKLERLTAARSILMVAAGTGEQLSQIPGPEAAGGLGFRTVYFTDGKAGSLDLALELMEEIFDSLSSRLVVVRSEHPSLRFSNRPEDEGRRAPVFRVVSRIGGPADPAHNFGPETWTGLTIVFAQAWSSELNQLFRGIPVDVVADVWGLCSFPDAEGYARDLKRFHDEHGAAYVAYMEHGVLRGNPDRTNEALYKVREEHFGKIACDPARDMETIVGRKVCGGDYALRVFKQGVQFFWFVFPRSGLPARVMVDFVPKVSAP